MFSNSLPKKIPIPDQGTPFRRMNHSDDEIRCLVFSSSIRDKEDLEQISDLLDHLPGILDWSVDLEDWEKVLRIESVGINAEIIKKILRKKGVYIRELPM